MTGFGHATGEALGRRCIVELRSFNHRFFDLKLRLPPLWIDPLLEQLVSQSIRRRVHRGSLIVTMREEGPSHGRAEVNVSEELARTHGMALRRLWAALRPVESPSDARVEPDPAMPAGAEAQLFALVAAQPGVLTIGENGLDAEARFRGLEPILENALHGLLASRQREGEALRTDLLHRLDEIHRIVEHAPDIHRRRLMERINRLLDNSSQSGPTVHLDPQRLAQEVALLADRIDVTEEITRLRAHMAEFSRLCNVDTVAGRQLDFLTQELNREVNTIGSKAQSSEVAARIVAMKAEIERLREQIQNVE
jgi:uncharacterized protein (TIGR00255 family)